MDSKMEREEIGKVEFKSYEETQVEWRIADFSSVVENKAFVCFESPPFSVANTTWLLELHPLISQFRLLIVGKMQPNYRVQYTVDLKGWQGSVKQLATGTFKEDQICDFIGFIKLSEALQQNDLTLMCTLRSEIPHSTQPSPLDKTNPLRLIRLDSLSQNFKDLFGKKETCDTTLKVNGKNYEAHRAVLIARSPVFSAMFEHETSEKQTGIITIPDCDPDSFRDFLEYLYCGKLEEITFQCAFHLYYTSDKYDVQELRAFCVEYLMQCITEENLCEIVILADKYDETELFSAAQDFFTKNDSKILVSSEWERLLKKDYRLANKLMVEMSKVRLGN